MNVFPITPQRYTPFIRDRANEVILLARSPHQSLRPFSSERKQTDSCVIGNGVPKSGTYLINSILNYLDHWENIGIHINPADWHTVTLGSDGNYHSCLPQFSTRKLRNGQLVAAHLPWSKGLEKSISHVTTARRIKHILIYRDPRDTMVSHLNYIAYSERYFGSTGHMPEQRILLEEFNNDSDRLTSVINSRMGFFYPGNGQGNHYLNFAPWLASPHCFAVKFEELYPELCDLKETGFGVVMKDLLTYLEVDYVRIDPVDFYDRVYGKSLTASGEVDKIGQYKRIFKSQHYDSLDNLDFKNLLHTFGYEW